MPDSPHLARLRALRARLADGELAGNEPELGLVLDEAERLAALLSGGTTEYAVQPTIDGRVGNIEDYGADRELLLVRLEQSHPDGYRLTVLTRQVVRTPWTPTTDPQLS